MYDNMKTAVDKVLSGKARDVNARFAAMVSETMTSLRTTVRLYPTGCCPCRQSEANRRRITFGNLAW
jgi:hypothetical protein